MTRVSKKSIAKSIHKELVTQITNLFAAVNQKTAAPLYESLFTETEQIMFIKRLAIILMIDSGYSRYRIAKTLKVSESTVKLIFLKYLSGAYAPIIKVTKTKKFDTEVFWDTLELLLRGGMPPMGKDRWKTTFKNLSR